MKRHPFSLCFAFGILTSAAFADRHVAVSAEAEDAYTKDKYETGGSPKRETYIVMRGRYHPGASVDRSIDRMPFRQVLGYLTPKLAKQEYVPAASVETADLLLVVHWGATHPRVATIEMMARSSSTTDTSNTAAGLVKAEIAREARSAGVETGAFLPESNSMADMLRGNHDETNQQIGMDQLDYSADLAANEQSHRNLAALLGYSRTLRKFGTRLSAPTDEVMLRSDLLSERYFIIVRAYRMHPAKKEKPPQPVWAIHLNISSPGNNFRTAMEHMSTASIAFVGRTTDTVKTLSPKQLETKVELGDPIILGEVK